MNNKTLGQFIAENRKEKGLTQRELSEMLQVSDKTISHWERDESSPDISILPELSAIFGITVDELLKREKNPPLCAEVITSQSENSMKESENSEKTQEETTEEKFRKYKLLSLIGTGFAVYSLISTFLSSSVLSWIMSYFTSFTYTQTIPLLSSLKNIVISLILTIGARIFLSHTFIPKVESAENVYIYKANRLFTFNLYLIFAVITFGVAALIDIPYITLFALTALFTVIGIVAIDSLLKAKGFLKPKNEKLFRLRLITIIVAAALILLGGGFWGFAEIWTPSPKEIVFDNIDEFVEYMETPCEKPEDAWRIDGVSASTLPPTMPLSTTSPSQTTIPSPVQTLPQTTKPEFYYASVLNPETGKMVTFKHLNGNAYRYFSSEEDGKFYVKTYKQELRPKNWGKLQDSIGMLVPLYCVLVIALSFIVYMSKARKLKK